MLIYIIQVLNRKHKIYKLIYEKGEKMKSKKILIATIAIILTMLATIVTLVIVLVSNNQSAKSNVIVKFVASDVSCKIEGKYAKVNMASQNTETYSFSSMGSALSINDTNTSGELSPSGEVSLDTTYSRVVFQYCVTNTMLSTPMYMELTHMPDNDTEGEAFDNINMLYYNDYTSGISEFTTYTGLFSGVYDSQLNSEMGKLVVPAQCTKYVYLVVTVGSITENATLLGQ